MPDEQRDEDPQAVSDAAASPAPRLLPLDPEMEATLERIRHKKLADNGGGAVPESLRLGDDNVVRSDQHASAAGKAEQKKVTTEALRHGGEAALPKVVAREHVPADIEETGEIFACLPPGDPTMVTREMGRDANAPEPRSEPPPEPTVVPVRAAWRKSYWLAVLLAGAPLLYAASVLVPRWTSDTAPNPRAIETGGTSAQTVAPRDTTAAATAPTPTPHTAPSAPVPTVSSAAPEPAPVVDPPHRQPPHVQPPTAQPPTSAQPKVKPPPLPQPSSVPPGPPTSSGFVPIHPIP